MQRPGIRCSQEQLGNRQVAPAGVDRPARCPQPRHHTGIRHDAEVVGLDAGQVVLEKVAEEIHEEDEVPQGPVRHSVTAFNSGVIAAGSPIITMWP